MGNLLIIISLFITILLYGLAKIANPMVMTSPWQMLAQISGLLGFLLLAWSYVLAVRHKFLEKLWGGLDKVYKIHHIVGGISFLLLLYHPIFLIINSLPTNNLVLYLLPITSLPYSLGIISLYLMILLIILTIFINMPYAFWKWTHEWMGLVVILGGLHSLLIFSDTSRFLLLKIWIILWGFSAFAAFVYKRFLYYWFLPKKNYKLMSVVKDGEIFIVTLSPKDAKKAIAISAGQYAFLSVPGQEFKREEHPFSLLRSENGVIQFGIKAFGSWTNYLSELPAGIDITVRGPFGKFGESARLIKEMVWIAGGIGITPFVSMAQNLDPSQKVTIYHSIKNTCSPYISRIMQFFVEQNPNLKWIEHDSKEGRLTAEMIFDQINPSANTSYYLCGSFPMMESFNEQLIKKGVSKKKIIFEDFSFK
jgi:predicted ferric reductase